MIRRKETANLQRESVVIIGISVLELPKHVRKCQLNVRNHRNQGNNLDLLKTPGRKTESSLNGGLCSVVKGSKSNHLRETQVTKCQVAHNLKSLIQQAVS